MTLTKKENSTSTANKKRSKCLKRWLAAFVVLFLLAGAAMGYGYYLFMAPQLFPPQTASLYIDRHDTAHSILQQIERVGHARTLAGLRLLMQYAGYDKHIHTGHYLIEPNENAYHLFRQLNRGHQEPVNLTIGSVRTLQRLAHHISEQLMMDSTEVTGILNDTTRYYFLPNTYEVYWDITPKSLLKRMKSEYSRFWTSGRQAKAAEIGLTPNEVTVLASIVAEETNDRAEKPMVAGLYINRLHRGMLLQADPTVKFALQNFELRRITLNDLQTDSPYNTYRYAGLPPSPIRIPTLSDIDAVLNYTHHNYIYMCAKEDFSGTHNFAATLAEHNRNARRYQQALNARRIYR
jgi:UPF0755 protein